MLIATMNQKSLEEKEPSDTDERTVIGPATNIKLVVVIALAGVLSWGGWVTSELSTIKAAAMSGAASHTSLTVKVELLSQRVDAIEARGSVPMQMLQKSVDKLAEELRLHEATSDRIPNQVRP